MTTKGKRAFSLLLVDNDSSRLQAIQSASALAEEGWLVRTARNGSEAITAMKEARTDIVVTDLHLPEMEGDVLLANVKRDFPNAVRLLIHDESDQGALRRGTGLAHRYLQRPINGNQIVWSIKQVLLTQLRIRRKEVANVIRETKELHVNTQPMQELLQTADDPNCDIEDLEPIILQHPTAVATTLQVANTAFFGAGGRVETIAEAIQMLGMDFVRNLAITELAKKQLNLSPGLQEIANAILQHSIETAQCGYQMRQFGVKPKLVQGISSLALLHDLGKLVMLANKGHEYADMMGRSIENDRPCWRIEQATYGCDHAAIGAFLFAMWGLPEMIIRAVAWHHEPEQVAEDEFCPVSLLHLSNYAAHAKHEMQFYCGDQLNTEIAERVGLPPDFVRDLD